MKTTATLTALFLGMLALTACSDNNTDAVDDQFEQNDDIANATSALATTQYDGIQRDDDWFRIDIPAGFERVVATLAFSHANGDINLELSDASGNVLTSSATTNDNEQINFTVSTNGDYYLRVYGSNSGNTYALSWESFVPPPADDQFEENDDFTSATALPATTAVSGVQLDDDWYRISVTPGAERVAASLTFINASGDIDLQLYDTDGTSMLATSNSSSKDFETIVFDVSTSGDYYLRVYNHQGSGTANTYSLSWEGRAPVDDLFEPNNDSATATPLAENTTLSGIQLDEDWYQINVIPGSLHLLIDLTFVHASGDLDIVLYDSALNFVALSDSSNDNEQIDFTVLSSGTYYLQIYDGTNVGGATGNNYDLVWTSSP